MMLKKQSTLFPQNEPIILAELDLKVAEALANEFKTAASANHFSEWVNEHLTKITHSC